MRLALAATALAPAIAFANGRAPMTNGVHFQPGNDRSIFVASTFGLLISRDDGSSFRWVCEQNIGYAGTFDPKYRIARDGAIFATTFAGLRVSRDGGCSFTTATERAPQGDPGRIAGVWIDAIDIGPDGDVWVATADNGKPNDIYRSRDGGMTFAPSGLSSPAIWWKSIAVAPSRAQRIYATGYQVAGALADGGQRPPATHLEISDDTGGHWQRSPLTGVAFATVPLVRVAGVDPGDPEIVLLTSLAASPPGDRLYRSTDGGMTFTEVLATRSAILDVAVSAGGVVRVATLGGQPFQSTDHGASFQPLAGAPQQLACIGQRGDGAVLGCAANWEPDFAAVVRGDGATWHKRFRFAELAGPLACPAGTAEHDVCAAQWPSVQQQFGATGSDAVAPPVTPRKAGGCCDAGGPSGGLGAIALAAGLGAALRRRRAR